MCAVDMKLHYGDLTDSTCLVKIINEVKPTEIYNLGAQSHVKVKAPLSNLSFWFDCIHCVVILQILFVYYLLYTYVSYDTHTQVTF